MENFSNKQFFQNCSTEGDSSSDREEDPNNCITSLKTNPLKHKTQLCKTYSQLGYCNYGDKCRFAHGKQELICSSPKKPHKNRKCKGFWKNGICSYGLRCQFGHSQSNWTLNPYLGAKAAIIEKDGDLQESRLLKLL